MEPMPEDWNRAVAVVAHPDDLEYGASSAVARWTDEGKQVVYVLVTSGEAGIDGMDPAVAGPLREEEQRRSAALVGAGAVEFLGHRDGVIEPGLTLRRDIADALRRHRPDIVITMNFDLTWGESGGVNHSDHRATGLTVLDACRDAANRWVFPESGEAWHGITSVYVAGSGAASHYVDVGGWLDRGVASLRAHQIYLDGLGRDFDPDEFLRSMAGYAGMAAGCEYAVTFQRYAVG
ncbi:MAG: PIG-L deacetylase family protein [Acidimicrobiales bacterium]